MVVILSGEGGWLRCDRVLAAFLLGDLHRALSQSIGRTNLVTIVETVVQNETVQNVGVPTPLGETDGGPSAQRRL